MLSRVPSAWKCHVMEMSSEIHSLDQKLQERVTWEPTVPYTSRCVYTWMEDVGDGPARGHKPVSSAGHPGTGMVPITGAAGRSMPPCWPRAQPRAATKGLWLAPGESTRTGGGQWLFVPLRVPLWGASALAQRESCPGAGWCPGTLAGLGPAPSTPRPSPGRWLMLGFPLQPGDGDQGTATDSITTTSDSPKTRRVGGCQPHSLLPGVWSSPGTPQHPGSGFGDQQPWSPIPSLPSAERSPRRRRLLVPLVPCDMVAACHRPAPSRMEGWRCAGPGGVPKGAGGTGAEV